VKLFEHADFEQSILRAAEHFRARGLRPAIIEKDYYVTEALCIVAGRGDRIIFKGGTSLAKGRCFADARMFTPSGGRVRMAGRATRRKRNATGKLTTRPNRRTENELIRGPARTFH
jgi:hypothetical protein